MKLIDLHKEWIKKGQLPMIGLCFSIDRYYAKGNEKLLLFEPINKKDKSSYDKYWGFGEETSAHIESIARDYTPLRQTIVLFICAMNNEI